MAIAEDDSSEVGGEETTGSTAQPIYLVDKSALARAHYPVVRDVLQPLAARLQLATCTIIDLELLYSARSPAEYRKVLGMRRANYRKLPITQQVCDRSVEVQTALAGTSQHRGASIPDLVIAACAEFHGAVVLHYDSDFDLVASVTGQPAEWVAPRGSLP
jgi:predicted nucleic acid-binding protein